jgi:ribosomal protein S18 acetylase RimI-like enzyme
VTAAIASQEAPMMSATRLAHRILPAGQNARAEVMATIAAAFDDDPAVRMLYPDAELRRRHFPGFAETFGGEAFALGAVDRAADGLGAALWFAPGTEPDGAAVMAYVEATVETERLAGMQAGFAIQASLHPHEPHWYLPFIGVRPEAQGQGMGDALLAHGLARADAARLPAYLEATSRRSVPLYRRHGFSVIGVVETPGFPEIFAMWRQTRR